MKETALIIKNKKFLSITITTYIISLIKIVIIST